MIMEKSALKFQGGFFMPAYQGKLQKISYKKTNRRLAGSRKELLL